MAGAAETQGQYEDKAEEDAKGGGAAVRLWLDALAIADKEEEGWRDRAQRVVEIYRDEKERSQRRYNILYANTETLQPAIYNSTPVPDVRPRFNSADPTAKKAATILEKAISYCIDEYDFSAEMEAVVQDLALPGRGVARVRYDPSVGPDGLTVYPRTLTEHVPWTDFRRGPGKLWRDVPWVAFKHYLSRPQLRVLNPDLAEQVNLDASLTGYDKDSSVAPPKEVFLRAIVWEIWDKEAKEVLFLAPSYKADFLRREPDPLGLTGFFPLPRPLYAVKTTTSLTPVELYNTYRDQAEELDRITRRISRLINVLKWRGVYAASEESSGWLSTLNAAEDGELVPATDYATLTAQGGGIASAIWLMPIREVMEVLNGLYAQREQIKQVIFEITGMADIMRGSTRASETATAQQIKAQWGSLRVQRMQGEVQRFVRDLFRIKAEIIAEHYDAQTLSMISEEEITPEIMQLLRTDILRSYRIDVETDSTIRADLTRAQENMSNFLTGTANFIAAVGPAVQSGQMPGDVAAEIYSGFARTFKLGKQAEDALDRMAQAAHQAEQQPKPPSPEEQKAQAEQAKAAADAQAQQAKTQPEQEARAADLQHRQALAMLDAQAKQAEAAHKEQMMALDAQERAEKLAFEREKMAAEREKLGLRAIVDQQKAMLDVQFAEEQAEAAAMQPEREFA